MEFILYDTTTNRKIKKGEVEVKVKGEKNAEENGFPTKLNDFVEIKITGKNVQGRL